MTSILLPKRFALREVLEVIHSRQYRKFKHAFGSNPGAEAIGRAAPIKGNKKLSNESMSAYVDRVKSTVSTDKSKQENWARGITAAADDAKSSMTGKTGVCCAVIDGVPKVLSRAAVNRAVEAGKKTVEHITLAKNYGEAMIAFNSEVGYSSAMIEG